MLVPLFVSENVPVPPVVGQLFEEVELELVVCNELLVDVEREEPDEDPTPLPEVVPAPEPNEVVPPPVAVPAPEVVPVPVPLPPAGLLLPRELALPSELAPPSDVPDDELLGPPPAPSPPAVPQAAPTAKRAQGTQERRCFFIGNHWCDASLQISQRNARRGLRRGPRWSARHGSSDSLGVQDPAALRNRRRPGRAARLEAILYLEVPMVHSIRAAMVVFVATLTILAAAQSSPADEEHHGPRPEALAACKDKTEGAACEFDGPKGHVTGTCRKTHTDDLACMRPHHHDAGAP
jgi:hypothetical protein